jgi:hypothetical protein
MNEEQKLLDSPVLTLSKPNQLLADSLRYYKKNWDILIGISIVPAVLSVVGNYSGSAGPLFALLGAIVFFFSKIAVINFLSGHSATVSDSYRQSLKMFFPVALVSFFSVAAVFGGLVLLIIPGVIMGVRLSQSTFIYITEGLTGRSALAKSIHYVEGKTWAVFLRYLYIGLIVGVTTVILSSIFGAYTTPEGQVPTLLFDALIITPISSVYGFLLFKNLRDIKKEELTLAAEEKSKRKISIYIIIAGVALILLVALVALMITFFFSYILNPSAPTFPAN